MNISPRDDSLGNHCHSTNAMNARSARKDSGQYFKLTDAWSAIRLESDAHQDAIIIVDSVGAMRFANNLAGELAGCPVKELMGSLFISQFSVINRLTGRHLEDPTMRCLRTQRSVQLSSDNVMVRSDGMEIPVPDDITPIVRRDGGILGVKIVFHSVRDSISHFRRTRCRVFQMPVIRRVSNSGL